MQKNIFIIYLDRNKFDCMVQNQIVPVRYDFSLHTVKDFEVLNKDALYSEIHTFLTTHHISSCSVIMILSNNVIFEKDLSEDKSNQSSDVATLFLERIPYETIMHRTIKFDKKTKIVATNKMYLDLLKDAFEKDHCKVLLTIPEFVVGNLISQKGLDTVAIKKIISKMDSLKQYDLSHLQYAQNSSQSHEELSSIPEKKSHTRLIVLLLVFILLIGILIVLFLISQKSSKKTIPKSSVKKNQLTPFPTSTTIILTPEITPQEELISPAEITETFTQ